MAMGAAAGAGLLAPQLAEAGAAAQRPMIRRAIPHNRSETIPVVGVGTSIVFNTGLDPAARAGPTAVVKALVAGGATLIDTAPSYQNAEAVVGAIVAESNLRSRVFISTKLERFRPGEEEAETKELLVRLKTDKVDLLHLHNVRAADQSMAGVNALKAKGLCRYTGVTTTFERDYPACEAIVKREKPDFVELDYAINTREAEDRLLPACIDAGSAVLVALPFGRGRVFRNALDKPLPPLAKELECATWAQFFLKWILAHPAITAVIPGTSSADHMIDNMDAGRGRMPDAKERAEMQKIMEAFA